MGFTSRTSVERFLSEAGSPSSTWPLGALPVRPSGSSVQVGVERGEGLQGVRSLAARPSPPPRSSPILGLVMVHHLFIRLVQELLDVGVEEAGPPELLQGGHLLLAEALALSPHHCQE